jgi:hypothetical protein
MAKRTINLQSTSCVALFASQKSSGKTTLAVTIADAFALNGFAFKAFQIDDQKRLSTMIGQVTDLRPNPDELIEDPTQLTRALVPFHDAVLRSVEDRTSVLLDVGANETENLANFLRDVDFDDDVRTLKIPTLAFVPVLPLDPESSRQSAFTISRLREAAPSLRIIMVENRFGGSCERIVPGSVAEREFKHLVEVVGTADRITMPAIAREYWGPFEGAGVRFIKAIAMEPSEGAALLGRSVGEFKVMRSNVVRFWREMHRQLSRIISLPVGGE